PAGDFRAKLLDSPLPSSPPQTTCTPLASAATAGALKKREKVSPLGQANGPSPQDSEPLPLNWLESVSTIEVTCAAAPKETPPSVDFDSQMSLLGFDEDGKGKNGKI